MRRREVLTLLGGMAVPPLSSRAQQARTFRIGVLVIGNADPEFFMQPFREGLRERGYVEGQSIFLEFRSAAGKASDLPHLADELVGLKLDVIVAWQTPAVQAAKQATSETPIVASAGELVGAGLVASLSKPGGNITGMQNVTAEVAAKRVDFLHQMLPFMRRLAVLANVTDPFTRLFLPEVELAGRRIGIEVLPFTVRPDDKFEPVFEDMRARQADAVYVQGSLLRREAVDLALRHRLPSIGDFRLLPEMGGLMSYAADTTVGFREIAGYVDKILKGARPADLPVLQPSKFDLVINLKTAKALGLAIPPTLLARADEVIE
jgi:putative tryptophan/tyrosine transport system substrate-binding protein